MAQTAELGHNPAGDEKMNNHFKSLLDEQIDSADSDTTEVKDQPKGVPTDGKTTDGGVMKSPLMTFTKMLEAMSEIEETFDNPADEDSNVLDEPIEDDSPNPLDDSSLLDKLNSMFTPILISQGIEQDIADHKTKELTEANVMTEKNVIAFDDETRYAQLVATCALLLAQKKNTPQWQMFSKAAMIRNKAKLAIQSEEYNDAKMLAQKYLLMVANTNNSSVARQAANDLLPQTQH